MYKYTLFVKCRVFAIKPDCTYNKKGVLKKFSHGLGDTDVLHTTV